MKLACIVGWDAPCGFSAIAEAPGAEPLLRAVPADGVTLPGDGPVAFRIRPLDRERVDCVFTTTRGALCLLAEIEAVVWEGDEFTRTAPLTVSQVVPQLRVFAPALSVTPSPSPTGCPLPPQTWRVTDDLRFDLIAVFPTVTDRVDAEPQLRGSNGPGCAVEGRSGGTAWATFENVMVLAVAEPGFQRTVVHALSGGGQYAGSRAGSRASQSSARPKRAASRSRPRTTPRSCWAAGSRSTTHPARHRRRHGPRARSCRTATAS